VIDRSWFYPDRNLVLYQERTVTDDGQIVVHSTELWAEAIDRDHARYIASALNRVGFHEVKNGSEQDNS
jgi:hypothetical protein